MRSGVWLDPDFPSQSWSAPVSAFRTPGWLRWLIAVLAVALIAGLLVGFGGFKERQDVLLTRQLGATLTTGPFDVTLQRVVVQRVQDYDDEWTWEIRLQGTVRNTWHEAISYRMGEFGWMAWRQPGSDEIVIPDGFSTSKQSVSRVQPTDEVVPAEWSGVAQEPPSAYLQVHMLDLEYTDNSLLGFGERTWNPADYTYQTWVPVIRLPDLPYQ